MEPKELFEVLARQTENLAKMKETADKKQRALISHDYKQLEASITEEQSLLISIQAAEKERITLMNTICRTMGVKIDNYRLYEFVDKTGDRIDRKSAGELLKAEEKLREIILAIQNQNQKNLYLIEHSRAFVKETLMTVLQSRKKLLDKKV
ncbi:MAG: flagellar protein FlgN [Bacteroidota bacterium]